METPPPPASSSFELPPRNPKGRLPQGVEMALPRTKKRTGTLRHTFEDLRRRYRGSDLLVRHPRSRPLCAALKRRQCRPRPPHSSSDAVVSVAVAAPSPLSVLDTRTPPAPAPSRTSLLKTPREKWACLTR
ncbi:hypothetical protein AHAS_Ahas05G0244600 [Arachis hypogaea]